GHRRHTPRCAGSLLPDAPETLAAVTPSTANKPDDPGDEKPRRHERDQSHEQRQPQEDNEKRRTESVVGTWTLDVRLLDSSDEHNDAHREQHPEDHARQSAAGDL